MNVPLKNSTSIVFAIVVAVTATSALGRTVTATFSGDGGISNVTGTVEPVDFRATEAEGGQTFKLFLDSAADILLLEATLTTEIGSVFNDTDPTHVATDHAPPIESVKTPPWFGDLIADFWVTTPGITSAADESRIDAGETVTHFDTTNDGAQSEFWWANVTLIPDEQGNASATLNATFQTAATPTPMIDEVTVRMVVGVPEPASFSLIATALLGTIGTLRRKQVVNSTRRLGSRGDRGDKRI